MTIIQEVPLSEFEFWFEEDWISEMIGFSSFEELTKER